MQPESDRPSLFHGSNHAMATPHLSSSSFKENMMTPFPSELKSKDSYEYSPFQAGSPTQFLKDDYAVTPSHNKFGENLINTNQMAMYYSKTPMNPNQDILLHQQWDSTVSFMRSSPGQVMVPYDFYPIEHLLPDASVQN
jgi:hypothetical protein